MFEFVKKIPFELNGKSIVCHSDLTIFGRELAQYKNHFIKGFVDATGVKNIFIPAFNLNTNHKEIIDLDAPPIAMGALASEAVGLCNQALAIRTPNPIHSYVVVGETSNLISECRHDLSFGKNSIFDYFIANDSIWLSMGASPDSGFTILHHVEVLASVPYRKWLEFERVITHNGLNQRVKYKYYGREITDLKQNFEPAVNYLIDNRCLFEIQINGRKALIGRAAEIVSLIFEKLIDNPYYLVKK